VSRIRQQTSFRWKIIWGIVGIAGLISSYSYLSYRQHLANPEDTTVPSIAQLVAGFHKLSTPQGAITKEVWLWKDASATYRRLFFGLMWGCILSIILGILMGCFPTLEAIMVPPLSFLAKVPATAMLAVFFVIVGTGEEMFVAMIGFGVLPVLAQGVYLSAKHDVHDEHTDKAYTLGASNYEVITGWLVSERSLFGGLVEIKSFGTGYRVYVSEDERPYWEHDGPSFAVKLITPEFSLLACFPLHGGGCVPVTLCGGMRKR
jgi:ABC-type nitrate/sulfonate/bicarbonate transport system permease component